MVYYRVETQMRAGTHYLLDALISVYHAKVAKIKGERFQIVSRQDINNGLYKTIDNCYKDNSTVIFHNHYFHNLPKDKRLSNNKTIFLIGYPFDSFISDGLIFSSSKYTVAPSRKNGRFERYRLCYQSKEWNFLEPFMIKNKYWLEMLCHRDGLIIRYEDFFSYFRSTINKIEDYFGQFLEIFPKPVSNPSRTYWTDEYSSKMDKKSFEKLRDYFSKSLDIFYPEKKPLLYQ